MKFFLISIIPLTLIGCGKDDLISIANEGRLFKISDMYDCRSQSGHPWLDSPHTELIAHLIDFGKKRELFHRGYYRDTILESPYDYRLSAYKTENHEFEQIFFDIEDIRETNYFIRFITIGENNKRRGYVINKSKMTLSPIDPNRGLSKELLRYGVTWEWTRNCRKI